MPLTHPQLVELNSKMNEHFSLGDIEAICFDLGIDFDSLPGQGKGAKIRELVAFCQRRGRDDELVAKVRAERPHVAWPGTPEAQTSIAQSLSWPFRKKITILFLAANPKDQDPLRLGEEMRTIDEQLRLAQHRDRFNLEQQWAVRTGDILAALRRYKPDIVHFSGHGSADGNLIFEDAAGATKEVSADALGELFRVLKGVRCVVMNACWSDKHAGAIAKSVDCVIGMARAVSDAAAVGFAAGFYGSLGDGLSVGEAFDLGKVQIMIDGGGEQKTPRLKMRAGVAPETVKFA